jgi:hypothetical protein
MGGSALPARAALVLALAAGLLQVPVAAALTLGTCGSLHVLRVARPSPADAALNITFINRGPRAVDLAELRSECAPSTVPNRPLPGAGLLGPGSTHSAVVRCDLPVDRARFNVSLHLVGEGGEGSVPCFALHDVPARVGIDAYDAFFVAQMGLPQIVRTDGSYEVSIVMVNSGTTSWSPSSIKLGVTAACPMADPTPSPIPVPATVAPLESVAFTFTLQASDLETSEPSCIQFQVGGRHLRVRVCGEARRTCALLRPRAGCACACRCAASRRRARLATRRRGSTFRPRRHRLRRRLRSRCASPSFAEKCVPVRCAVTPTWLSE